MNITPAEHKNAEEKLNDYIAPKHMSAEDMQLLSSELKAILKKIK